MSEKERPVSFAEEFRETKPFETNEVAGNIQNCIFMEIAIIITNILNAFSILSIISGLITIVYGVWFLVVLFSMGKVVGEYKNAAISKIIGAITILVGVVVDAIGISVGWVVVLAGALVLLMAEYNVFKGHEGLLFGIDDALAKKWKNLWVWYCISLVAILIGNIVEAMVYEIELTVIIALGVIPVLMSIIKLVYLMKMYNIFDGLE